MNSDEIDAAVAAYKKHGKEREAAEALGQSHGWIQRRLRRARKLGRLVEPGGRVEVFQSKQAPLPGKGRKAVYILTSAQDRTRLHRECWDNLLALAEHDHAKIMVSTFKYNKDAQGQRAQAKFETREAELAALYPVEIRPYICDHRVDLAPNLVWCGELNVLPTAESPLSGLESYTYRKSTIVPHPKLELRSVPAMKGEGVKLLYTTGCVTQRNYIKRKVGYKAESYHSYGALIVEIDHDGFWWCRQLQLGPDGAIYDLERKVKNGKVTTGHRVYDVCWGDIHCAKIDVKVADLSWGHHPRSILETLRPRMQHVHDLLDFSGRSHHTRKDPHAVFASWLRGNWLMSKELAHTGKVVFEDVAREWCETIVVNSNHDRHMDRFLKEMDWREDPANAELILGLNAVILKRIREGTEKNLCLLEHALKWYADRNHPEVYQHDRKMNVRFLREDESHVILPDIDGGIECGLHGDRGANGAKGTINGIAKIDRKVNGADKHAQAIVNHAYFCGTNGELDQGWNHGLSSWSVADTVTYDNGTRAIIAPYAGKWRG